MARKPSLRIKQNKNGLMMVKTFYDELGNVIKKQTEFIRR